jgi:hypothetical protein
LSHADPGRFHRVANVTPQTASGDLSRLSRAALVVVEQQGRHRYHRLASAGVAHMLESIMSVASDGLHRAPKSPVVVGPRDQALRRARTCYDHLAGEVAVAIADRMTQREFISLSNDGGVVTEAGSMFLLELGVDMEGAAICKTCFSKGWLRPVNGTRAVKVTPTGRIALRKAFDLELDC